MVKLDVDHVFRVFGGPRGLLACLDRHQKDHGLSYPTVQMWSQRGSIPTKMVMAVIYTAEREGHDCTEFMVDTQELSDNGDDNDGEDQDQEK